MIDPFQEMAQSFKSQIKKGAGEVLSGVPAELGTITDTGLKLDNFKDEIQDYLVADFLAALHLPAFYLVGTTVLPDAEDNPIGTPSQRTRFDFEPSLIQDVRVNLAAGLMPGERVLVMPTNGGADFVVLCRVVNNNG
ncbi:hypothetical protein J41TS12_10570 [Paenibacillus antibioticophila]|uniref:Uncharacterized protein n=1 Tax=Paenibacillus antibioticophila TaxID=1274374 RepID=A0A919XPU7_9BACL|nr:hypothetical protein [Paenibacillus antibioticophila]GIO36196.1 hypothetical protein J41TS12_10570 [Paenibacillus antibioticophila]